MKKYKSILIVINLLIVLLMANVSIFSQEKILTKGQLVFFELAPVDPRSLMQGDYMILNYIHSRAFFNKNIPKKGYLIFTLDQKSVAKALRLQEEQEPLKPNEYAIIYQAANHRINIGAESYFFQEGHGERYQDAKYGGIRFNQKGKSVLTGLYDQDLELIK